MIKSGLLIVLILLLHDALSQQKDIEELTRLNKDWLELSMKKDTAAFARIFADDFLLIAPNGNKITKSEGVRNILYQDPKSIKIDSIDVRILTNDVGLLTCYITYVFLNDGKEMTGRNSYQDVYIKRKGRWFAVAAHVTLLNVK